MKITVCTLAINEWYREIVSYSIKNLQHYSNEHNYNFVFQDENSQDTVYDKKRAPCWYKIKLIEKILQEDNCDYIVWIDADTQVLKHEMKLEYFIEKYFKDETELVLTMDTNILNTGVMFIKNSEFNKNLMKKIWENSSDYFVDFHEQTSLADLYVNDKDIAKHIEVIPYGIKDEIVVYWGNYYPNKHFLIHCARCSNDLLGFMYMMDLYYPFKLDEETEDEFQARINWLTNIDVCRGDIDKWLKQEYIPRNYSARCKKKFMI